MSSDGSVTGTNGNASTLAVPKGPKPLRAMLARGAACDTCRSRKVKCDSLKPVCSQCVKSARGNLSEISCVYEGGASARARGKKAKAPPSALAPQAPSSLSEPPTVPATSSAPFKRDREPASEDDEEDGGGHSHSDRNGAARKRQSGGTAGQRVETLVERISELERRLRLQSQPVAVHTHVRASASPPFYPSPYLPNGGSAPMEARRSMSFSGDIGSEPTPAHWTPESSIRFSGRPLGAEPPGANINGKSSGTSEAYHLPPVPNYASFIPPLPHLFDETHPGDYGRPPPVPTAYPNGSSYPPLNYSSSPGLALNGNGNASTSGSSSSGGISAATMSGLQASNAYGIESRSQVHSPVDYYAYQQTDIFDRPFPTPSTDQSGIPSPDDTFSMDASLLQMLYPSWPASLPLPTTVHHLLTVFFNRATVPAAMFNRGRIFAALELAPDDPGFPSTALLHALCAYASIWVSPETLGVGGEVGHRKYWESEDSPREYHCRMARAEIDKGLAAKSNPKLPSQAPNFFQILQAILLQCYMAYHSASFTELWLLSGLATRLCTPLGLNHQVPWNFSQGQAGDPFPDWRSMANGSARHAPSVKTHALLPPPRDIEEHHERAATFWAAFSIDRHTSASTDWSTSIEELDISTKLPALTPAAGLHSSVRDPNFLHEDSSHVGPMGLYIKAVILLGRVTNYLQRLPRYQAMPEGETCMTMRTKIKGMPEFVELDFALSKFRTMPSADFFVSGSNLNGHLASAYAIPHVASILLHEPFIDAWERGPTSSLARCLTSAKCVVNSTYILYQSSNDLSGLDPFFTYCWTVVGRALVRDHAMRRLWGDIESAQFSRTLAEHCLAFTASCSKGGVGILEVMRTTMEKLLADPDSLLAPDSFDEPQPGSAPKCTATPAAST